MSLQGTVEDYRIAISALERARQDLVRANRMGAGDHTENVRRLAALGRVIADLRAVVS